MGLCIHHAKQLMHSLRWDSKDFKFLLSKLYTLKNCEFRILRLKPTTLWFLEQALVPAGCGFESLLELKFFLSIYVDCSKCLLYLRLSCEWVKSNWLIIHNTKTKETNTTLVFTCRYSNTGHYCPELKKKLLVYPKKLLVVSLK